MYQTVLQLEFEADGGRGRELSLIGVIDRKTGTRASPFSRTMLYAE